MAKIELHVCDRCGKAIIPSSRERLRGRIHKRRIFGFGPYDYIDAEYELCQSCADELDEFLREKKKGADHAE